MSRALDALPAPLRSLHRFGVLRDLDIYLVEMLRRRNEGGKPEAKALLACCLASRVVDEGHICLVLSDVSPGWVAGLATDAGLGEDNLPPEAMELCRELAAAGVPALIEEGRGLIGTPESASPVVAHAERLYLRRYWRYESSVASKLREMSRSVIGSKRPPGMSDTLAAMLPEREQRRAAQAAMERRLTVITGGPGTGKTYTAARILALLLRYGGSGALPVVRLAAPTGKGAARLDESVRDAMKAIGEDDEALLESVAEACTIDRLLGYVSGSPYFRHNRDNPLPADAVLIDEASMVDLPKMAKLLDALDDDCRLVLLGDMHQLASVDPGSVMADLCTSPCLAESVIELTDSRRFPAGSPVAELGRAVNAAAPPSGGAAAWKRLTELDGENPAEGRIVLHAVPAILCEHAGRPLPDLSASVLRGFDKFVEAADPAKAFAALAQFRILCALRRGPHGVETVNGLVENILSSKTRPEGLPKKLRDGRRLVVDGEFYHHRVVMVTRNDYSMELFNGDVGIVMPDDEEPDRLVVWFQSRRGDTGLRKIPCRLLPEHETAFAITVHKAQGSEFDQVLVLLPERDSPVLTKELIYTAITRTRGGVELWCNRDVFEAAAQRAVRRSSGLLSQLATTPPSDEARGLMAASSRTSALAPNGA